MTSQAPQTPDDGRPPARAADLPGDGGPTTRPARGWPDLQLAGLVGGVAALLYFGAASLPAPLFDPLGSAAVPQAVAVVLVAFALLMVVPALRRAPRPVPAGPVALLRGGTMVALATGYTFLLDLRIVPFWAATLVFVPLAALIISPRRDVAMVALAIGATLGIGGQALFTRIFYIDLPV